MRGAFLDDSRLAIDGGEQPAIGFEMVEPGPSKDQLRRTMRLLDVGEDGVEILAACTHLRPAERAGPVRIMVREVNAHPAVRIGWVAPKAAELLPPYREAFRGQLREEGL